MSSRDTHIDNAKGVLIILVLLGHLVWPVPSEDRASHALYIFIYFFHMPMFALISGYLSRATIDRSGIVKTAKRLLAPYMIFIGIQWGILSATGQDTQPLQQGHFGLWFLLSLFCWRLLLPLVLKLPYPILMTVAASLACGFIPQVGMDFSLSRTINFMPFFVAGHLFRERSASPVTLMKKPIALAILLLAALAAAHVSQWNVQGILYGAFSYQDIGLPPQFGPAARAAQLFMAFATGLAALALVPKTSCIITRIGRHSLHVYLLHSPLLVLYRTWPECYGFLGNQPWAMIPVAIAVAWLLSSKLVVKATRRLVAPME